MSGRRPDEHVGGTEEEEAKFEKQAKVASHGYSKKFQGTNGVMVLRGTFPKPQLLRASRMFSYM